MEYPRRMEEDRMKTLRQCKYTSDASFFVSNYCFCHKKKADFLNLNPRESTGTGYVVEINPHEGLYLSYANWTPKINMERKYCILKKFIKLYFLECGDITLIQNGKKKSTIQHGVNLYLNKPSSGRVLYGSMTPIRYVSILLHEEYFDRISMAFPKDGLSLEDAFLWISDDYNAPEISKIFMQIRKKMIEGITSSMYYESKILEVLSLISQRHQLEQHNYKNTYLVISQDELYLLKSVGNVIRQTPISPPSIEELCKISTMSQTKLRELFKKVYGIPIGKYIQQCKLEQSLVLLSGSSLSIAEIAGKLGYANTSKFSAAFKRQYKKTPSEYRTTT